jgi:predicted XRE-type DNA-binding protein
VESEHTDPLTRLAEDLSGDAASRQLTRYTQAWLRAQGFSQEEIAQLLALPPST